MRPALAVLALATTGCVVVEKTPPPVWKAPRVERWRLTEVTYGEVEAPWASAGDGQLPADRSTLVFEPVFRTDTALRAATSPRRYSPCFHRVRVRYEGPESLGVGSPAEMEIALDGPTDVGHVVSLEGSHPGVEIRTVGNATPVAGEARRYLIGPGARARVSFTSRYAGRAGLRVAVLGEVDAPQQWMPEAVLPVGR